MFKTRRVALVAAGVGAAVALFGCGASEPSPTASVIDTSASSPSPTDFMTFPPTASPSANASPSATPSPTSLSSPSPSGKPAPAGQINMDTLKATVSQQYATQSGGATLTLTCPRSGNIPATAGDTFDCSFTDSKSRTGHIRISITTNTGAYTWAVL